MLSEDKTQETHRSLILAWKNMFRTCHTHQWLFEETQTYYHPEVW
jgi:hypothetical protein